MFRIGFGSDIHKLAPGGPLILGGVKIPAAVEAVGHSDADVLLHAVTDAILGALALGDIGSHFSDTDESFRDADSRLFLHGAVRLMKKRSYRVGNLDATITLERPKLNPHIPDMRANLAEILSTDTGSISVKAKTNERLDAVGRERAIRAEAAILLMKSSTS